MAEFIDRDKTIAEIDDCFPANPTSEFSKGVAVGLAMAKVAVNHTPAADVRPVVLCRDCEHWDIDWVPNYAKENEHFCPIVTLTTRDDWFCADGEKREES